MFKELVIKNRTCRGYDENYEISKEELFDMVDHARFCATGANKQPLRFCLINDNNITKEIVKITKWAAALKDLNLPKPQMSPTSFIVIFQDLEINANKQAVGIDVGIAAQTILLSATEKNLSGCMIALFDPDVLSDLLNINKERYYAKLVIAIGKPKETIFLTDIEKGQSTDYYRDKEDNHYVPKIITEDLIL